MVSLGIQLPMVSTDNEGNIFSLICLLSSVFCFLSGFLFLSSICFPISLHRYILPFAIIFHNAYAWMWVNCVLVQFPQSLKYETGPLGVSSALDSYWWADHLILWICRLKVLLMIILSILAVSIYILSLIYNFFMQCTNSNHAEGGSALIERLGSSDLVIFDFATTFCSRFSHSLCFLISGFRFGLSSLPSFSPYF